MPGQTTEPEPHKKRKHRERPAVLVIREVICPVFFLPYLMLLKPYFSKQMVAYHIWHCTIRIHCKNDFGEFFVKDDVIIKNR